MGFKQEFLLETRSLLLQAGAVLVGEGAVSAILIHNVVDAIKAALTPSPPAPSSRRHLCLRCPAPPGLVPAVPCGAQACARSARGNCRTCSPDRACSHCSQLNIASWQPAAACSCLGHPLSAPRPQQTPNTYTLRSHRRQHLSAPRLWQPRRPPLRLPRRRRPVPVQAAPVATFVPFLSPTPPATPAATPAATPCA